MEKMKAMSIYTGRETVFAKELEQLKNWKTSQRNKELITSFQNFLFSKTSKELRVSKLSSQLRRICSQIGKDLDTATKEDILTVVAYYNRQESYSEATKSDYRRTIKQFYHWFQDEDKRISNGNKELREEALKLYRYLDKEVKTSYKLSKIDPKTIITDEDIDKVLEACDSMRDKALIKFLHESGARVGELLNMKVGDICFLPNHANVTLDGKTGKRTIPIVNSASYLVQYLGVHPHRKNDNAYLWLGEATNYPNKPLMHKSCQLAIYRAFEKAGLKDKRQNLHWFRHSRASLLAPSISEAMLCTYMGWSIGSKQVRTYVHLKGKQLEDTMLQFNGLAKEEDSQQRKPQTCLCSAVNDAIAKYCYKCGKPLNVKVVLEDKQSYDEEMSKSIKLLMEIAKDPELLKRFEEFKVGN